MIPSYFKPKTSQIKDLYVGEALGPNGWYCFDIGTIGELSSRIRHTWMMSTQYVTGRREKTPIYDHCEIRIYRLRDRALRWQGPWFAFESLAAKHRAVVQFEGRFVADPVVIDVVQPIVVED